MVLQKEIYTSVMRIIPFFSLLLMLLISSQLKAQARDVETQLPNKKNSFNWDKVVIGGGFGVAFGNVTNIDLSPTFGYKIKDSWLAGIGTRYIYLSDRRITPAFTTNIYGGGPFTQLYFLENFLVHTEYEFLNVEQQFNSFEGRVFIQSWLVGGGYRSQIGRNSFANFIILWDLSDDINSPYSNPIIRVNLAFGL